MCFGCFLHLCCNIMSTLLISVTMHFFVVVKMVVALLNMRVQNCILIASVPDLCSDGDKATNLRHSSASCLALVVFKKYLRSIVLYH